MMILERNSVPELAFAESMAELRENLDRFNAASNVHLDRALSLISQSQYWVYDDASDQFAPSKFSAYANMSFARYEKAVAGDRGGAHFDGSAAQKQIQKVLRL